MGLRELVTHASVNRRIRAEAAREGVVDKRILGYFLPHNPVILDVGAYDGADSVQFAHLFPQSQIVAIEANPLLASTLRRNLRTYSQIEVVIAAVSTTAGIARLRASSGKSRASSSILEPSAHRARHPGITFSEADIHNIASARLDTVMNTIGLDHIDLLWLDVQGAELLALESLGSKVSDVAAVYLEVSHIPLYIDAAEYADVKRFLAEAGFFLAAEFLPSAWQGEGNALFLRTSIYG